MTRETQPEREIDPLRPVLRRTRIGMMVETVLRSFWPLGSLLAVIWSAIAFGLAEVLSRMQLLCLLAVAGGAVLWLLIRGIRALRWPSVEDARDRVDATLPGRPLEAMRDSPAMGREDPGTLAVWALHIQRMRALAAGARPVRPDLRLARRDPWGLRLGALVMLIAAVIFARGDGVRGVSAALAPGGAAAVATGPSFEGWAAPPSYTGHPTLYLPEIAEGQSIDVPAGTTITIRAYGEAGRFELAEDVGGTTSAPLTEAAPGIASAEFTVTRDGTVSLTQGGRALGKWAFHAIPDLAPTIAVDGAIGRAPTGETRLGYVARDDYGIKAARAEIKLDPGKVDRRYGLAVDPSPRPPLTVDLPLPMVGAGEEVRETLVEDLSKDPLAGLPVTVTLMAEDGLGQTGTAPPVETILPGRPFYDPLAAALVEQRRDLLWSPANVGRVVQVLRAVTYRPETVFKNMRAYLITRVAIRQLASIQDPATSGPTIDQAAEALWQAAVLIEDGDLGDAKARLERAKERLSEALKNDASDEEIARLMDELRQATQDYMRQMAQEAIERGDQQQAENSPDAQEMTQDQIQELMNRIQELSEQGRKAEAEQLLGMLQQMLENMQMRMGQGGEGQGSEGQRAMQGLADTLRQQQGLADESFDQLQREFRQGGDQPGQGSEPGETPNSGDLAKRQDALRDLMKDMQRKLPGQTGEGTRQALRDAERNMGEAGRKLSEGDTSGALDQQAEAIDRLREGLRGMGDDLRKAEGTGEGEQGQGEGQAENDSGGNDPLGRPLGSRGGVGGNESVLPDGDAAARARQLLDEIRRRSSDQGRPTMELDYLRRLLDQF